MNSNLPPGCDLDDDPINVEDDNFDPDEKYDLDREKDL